MSFKFNHLKGWHKETKTNKSLKGGYIPPTEKQEIDLLHTKITGAATKLRYEKDKTICRVFPTKYVNNVAIIDKRVPKGIVPEELVVQELVLLEKWAAEDSISSLTEN